MDLKNIIKGLRPKGQITMSGLVYELLASPKVTGSIVKAIEASFSLKTAVDKNLQFAYKSMNLNSRVDFHNLAAKVNELSRKQRGLDSEIENLAKRIDRISNQAAKDET